MIPVKDRPDDALLRGHEVDALCGVKKSCRYKKIQRGEFPAPIKITAHASAWRLGDIRAWLADPLGWKPETGSRDQ